VCELIEILKTFDPEKRVVLDGYEGGLCDIKKHLIDNVEVALNRNTNWYYGPHELAFDMPDEDKKKFIIEQAVYLPRP